MISLKKHIELHPGQLLDSTLDAYRESLMAMGNYGASACPALGSELQECLGNLKARLSTELTPETVSHTGKKVVEELKKWGDRAASHHKRSAVEVKEVLITLAHTAEAIAERDTRYVGQLREVTGSLRAIANLDDVAEIRRSIMLNTSRLNSCMEQLTRENDESVRHLKDELSRYQTRLAEADRLASQDQLTGLSSRSSIESQIQSRLARAVPFCILVLDLNGFKQVNDVHGHLAGDDLLKQFAARLRSTLRPADLIGRWGGDEFVVVLDCEAVQSASRIVSIHKGVSGEYLIQGPARSRTATVTAAVGLAAWRTGDSMEDLFKRADEAMYEQKRDAKRNAGLAPASASNRFGESRAPGRL